ncbi:MAG: hypothetical protein QE274_04565 [Verrucomicrobiaceae bacterium]|nr:hypothetical protein [Verrucomicrobiaceae bacterium]
MAVPPSWEFQEATVEVSSRTTLAQVAVQTKRKAAVLTIRFP